MDDYSLVPVEHQPDFNGYSLVPIYDDPFSAAGVAPPEQNGQAQIQQPTLGASQSSAPAHGVGTDESTGAYQNPFTAGTSDFFKSIPREIVSGLISTGSALARATQAEMGQEVDAPTPEEGMEILEKEVTGPMHRPEGRLGEFGASVGRSLGNPTSYLVPGSLPVKVGTAVLSGLGSEAGGQLSEGTPWESPLRFVGGALGVLGPLGVARLGTGARAAETALTAEGPGSGRAAAVTAKEAAPAAAEEVGAAKAPDGKFYSVLFEHRLKPESYPTRWRYKHNREANEAFLLAMKDEAFAQAMQDLGVKLKRTRTGLAPRRPPPGFTWHHAEEPGVMQLVPRWQHDPGSIFQGVLHPGGRGGWSIWGKS